jgi:hypothetical protein
MGLEIEIDSGPSERWKTDSDPGREDSIRRHAAHSTRGLLHP